MHLYVQCTCVSWIIKIPTFIALCLKSQCVRQTMRWEKSERYLDINKIREKLSFNLWWLSSECFFITIERIWIGRDSVRISSNATILSQAPSKCAFKTIYCDFCSVRFILVKKVNAMAISFDDSREFDRIVPCPGLCLSHKHSLNIVYVHSYTKYNRTLVLLIVGYDLYYIG